MADTPSKKKTILVTGGAGFIGSHLCERLVKSSHKVISLDNYFTGSKDNHIAGVEYLEGHTTDIEQYMSEVPDIIYHLGEYSRVAKSLEETELVFDLNVEGTFGVLEFWRKNKCKLVYAGSSTKFSQPREDGVEGSNLAPYTFEKSTNSQRVHNYGRWYDLPYSIVYFYNVYGPGERAGVDQYGTVIETFKQQYLHSEPFTVRKPGNQVRNFTHIEDTIGGILLVGEKGEGKEYGISAEESYSLKQVADMFDPKRKIDWLETTKTTRSGTRPDTSDITRLGWEQNHTLKDYIDSIKQQSA